MQSIHRLVVRFTQRDSEIERLVDVGNMNYYEACLVVTGKPPDNSDFTSEAILARIGREQTARAVGELICGDCLYPAPCGHITLSESGQPLIKD